MPTLIQVELGPEYVKFPSRCVCCAGPDERNVEMAVGSTDPDEHERSVIMEVELPYCLECAQHAETPVGWWRIVAVLVALSMVSLFSTAAAPRINDVVTVASVVLFVGFIVSEWLKNRRMLHPSCTARSGHVVFGHPTTTRLSTIAFTNERVAESFKDLNRFSVIER